MDILNDISIFAAVVQQGGFSHAAKYLGLSNGLISRRISQLEAKLGVTLIKRTTRQLHLTREGELLEEYAQRIQKEIDEVLCLIQTSAQKPRGNIRISAPVYFGRNYLTPIIMKFLNNFNEITIDLVLDNKQVDPIKEHMDLVIRGAGYLDKSKLKNSGLKSKLLAEEKVGLYANQDYLTKYGYPKSPNDLLNGIIVGYANNKIIPNQEIWEYTYKNKNDSMVLKPVFSSNDIASNLAACIAGYGIGRFTELNARIAIQNKQLLSILSEYDWGHYYLFAIYTNQVALPKRVRLLLDFISMHMNNITHLT